jgi:hypothetical protein
MWTGWSRLSPVERPWCRDLYLLVLDGPASLLTVPAGQKERTGERESWFRTDWSRVRERGGRPGCLPGANGRGAGNGRLVRVVGLEAGSGSELVSEAESGRE